MSREEHFYFTSSEGSVRIHGVRWIPDGDVRAVVQLVHGMSEYIERYREFAQFLAERGIVVVGHDHLGHGESAPSGESLGYFAKKQGNVAMVRDMHKVLCMTKKQYGSVPYVMFGHSMGSFLTRQYLCCHGTELDAAVICGTGNQPEPVVRAGLLVCRAEAALFGWHYRSRLMNWMMFGSFNAKFRPNRTSSDWLCRDEAVVDRYIADPKCGFAFTLNGYYNLLLGLYKIGRREYLERMPRDLPVLFIAGDKDPVGNFGKGVREVEQTFREVGMRDVECRLYPESRHELLNDLDRHEVYGDVLKWLAQHGLLAGEGEI